MKLIWGSSAFQSSDGVHTLLWLHGSLQEVRLNGCQFDIIINQHCSKRCSWVIC